jgi:G3E family GTPase
VRRPVTLVTGFLGSGKTTLLAALLRRPELSETAVIVNELGEVGLDHHLLRRVDERTVLLSSGCVCCTLRGDLSDELRDLLDRSDAGEIPPFRRVVVETTGIADPTPIVNTLLTDPFVPHHYELDAVVATVDGQHGLCGPESVKQVAAADVLVLTKPDLADEDGLGGLERELAAINPVAPVLRCAFGEIDPQVLLDAAQPQVSDRNLGSWRPGTAPDEHGDGDGHRDGNGHGHGVRAVVLELDEAVDWTAFGIWLTMLLHARGSDLYRVKGLLDVGGDGPLLVNGVQHAVHPPVHLDDWPEGERRSRLVVIGRGVDAAELTASLQAFDRVARST